jgi:hypothetical protein
VTHIYIKPSSSQRSTTSRVASAAGRLRPNGVLGSSNLPRTGGQNGCSAFGIFEIKNKISGRIVLSRRASLARQGCYAPVTNNAARAEPDYALH